jgi:hypothetical protein
MQRNLGWQVSAAQVHQGNDTFSHARIVPEGLFPTRRKFFIVLMRVKVSALHLFRVHLRRLLRCAH